MKCLTSFLLQKSNQWLGSVVWDPQRQQTLRLEGNIIIVVGGGVGLVVVDDWKVTIKRNKKGLVTPASGSPEVDQGLTRRSLKTTENKM